MPSLPDRPKALTEDVQKTILESMMLGMHLKSACALAGIQMTSVQYWMRLVEEGAEHAQIYADFCNSIKKVQAVAERDGLVAVRSGGSGWQGNAWFLERRFPKRWGKKDRAEASSTDANKFAEEIKDGLRVVEEDQQRESGGDDPQGVPQSP